MWITLPCIVQVPGQTVGANNGRVAHLLTTQLDCHAEDVVRIVDLPGGLLDGKTVPFSEISIRGAPTFTCPMSRNDVRQRVAQVFMEHAAVRTTLDDGMSGGPRT